MSNENTPIKGYRQLTETEIAKINNIKDYAERMGRLVEDLALDPGCDTRWVAVARTQLQIGIMALTRAVAQPETF